MKTWLKRIAWSGLITILLLVLLSVTHDYLLDGLVLLIEEARGTAGYVGEVKAFEYLYTLFVLITPVLYLLVLVGFTIWQTRSAKGKK